MIDLTADEKSIRATSDGEVDGWLANAKNGDVQSREKLCCWAYLVAAEYYHNRTAVEKNLTTQDAEDLTAEFFTEFEQALPTMRSATHFSRSLLKRKLRRYLQRERWRYARERSPESVDPVVEESSRPWEQWSDVEWYQYRATLLVLSEADATTRQVIELRTAGKGYDAIAAKLGVSETSLRMRVMRFCKAVRVRYNQMISGALHDFPPDPL